MNATQGPGLDPYSSQVCALLDETIQGSVANDRPDLVDRLRTARLALLGQDAFTGPTGLNDPASSANGGVSPDRVRFAAQETLRAVKSLEADLRARATMLTDASRSARLQAEYAAVQGRYNRFTEASREWQTVLGEGFAALNSQLDFYLRDRLRAVRTDAELAISSGNPTKMHEPFQAWLRQRLITEADMAYQWLHTSAHDVAGQIASRLDLPTVYPLPTPRVVPSEKLVAELPDRPTAPRSRPPIPTRVLTVFMPAYSGIMMTMVASRYLGGNLPGWVIGAFAVGGALTLGGAAASGERGRQRERRQSEAVASVRATVEEYQLALTQQLRDAARWLQQDLRRATADTVTRMRDTLITELDPIAGAANKASRAPSELVDIHDDLGALTRLRQHALDLLNPPPTSPSGTTRNFTLLTGDGHENAHADNEGNQSRPGGAQPGFTG